MRQQAVLTNFKVADIGEFGLINHLTGANRSALHSNIVGAGDDCAVIPSALLSCAECLNTWTVMTTDVLVDGVHFRLSYSEPFVLGSKLLAVTLSDIAAMGATPVACVVTLQLPSSLPVKWVDELYDGLYKLARKYDTAIVGGDTVSANELALGTTAIGVAHKRPVFRSGARVGDDLWISGEIGGAGAGLWVLSNRIPAEAFVDAGATVLERHHNPIPRVELGKVLLEREIATSLIDVSDGLLQDAQHIATRSNVTIELSLNDIPYVDGIIKAGYPEAAALTGGEDYELLFTACANRFQELRELSGAKVGDGILPQLSKIGSVVAVGAQESDGVVVRTRDGNLIGVESWLERSKWGAGAGFRHFKVCSQ